MEKAEVDSMLADLKDVGPHKPMGYLTERGIRHVGVDPDSLASELEAQGLKVQRHKPPRIVVNSRRGFVSEPSLYAYHEEALRQLLEKNRDILIEAKWPQAPAEFVRRVANESAKGGTKLYNLIAEAFNDGSNILPLEEQPTSIIRDIVVNIIRPSLMSVLAEVRATWDVIRHKKQKQ